MQSYPEHPAPKRDHGRTGRHPDRRNRPQERRHHHHKKHQGLLTDTRIEGQEVVRVSLVPRYILQDLLDQFG